MFPVLVALLLPAVLLAGDLGPGAGLFISPVQIYLSPRASTGVLTLRNQSPEPARFQLAVFAWEQGTEGEAHLTPTHDIVFSPPLLILAPKEERKIRLASETSAVSVEKTYRLLIEELRPPKKDSEEGQQLRMMTTFSLPIFLPPVKPVTQGRIESLTVGSHHWTFQLKNTGNVHVHTPAFSIQGIGSSGDIVLERQVAGGYVLAGTAGLFQIEFTRAECMSLRSLRVNLKGRPGNAGAASQVFDVPPNSCQ